MLEVLRKHSGGIVAKAFIAVLVLSFAVWGVGDIFRGYRSGTVITVGDTEISAEDFRFAYQTELQRLARQFGRTLSTDETRALQVDSRVIGRLVTEATLDNDARKRRLGITTDAVARSIAEDPTFRDPAGRFNKAYFDQLLRATGLSEAAYVEHERRLHLRQQISAAITIGTPVPSTLVEALHRYREERRSIAYLVVRASALPPLPEPDEAALRQFYDDNRLDFRLPEYRRFEIIDLTPAARADTIDVPEEDIVASYEARKASFETPERREVQQIVFPSADEAAAAAGRIAGGADFLDIARERGLSENDVSLGLLDRGGLVDPAVRETVFSLGEGEVSKPVAGALGVALVRVVRIEPGAVRNLDEVRADIRRELVERRAQDTIFDLHDKIEDERATGAPFDEIARKLGLDHRIVEAMDASGRDPQGAPVAGLPAGADVILTVAENDPGVELDALHAPGGGFVWVNVLDVTPARSRTFEEARADIEAAWRTQETRRRLTERANELAARLEGGETLETLSAELSQPLVETPPLPRNATDDALSPAAIQAAFSLPVGGHAVSVHANGTDRLLLQARASEVPPLDAGAAETAQLADAVRASIEASLLGQYVAARQDSFGVTVNRPTLQALLGDR